MPENDSAVHRNFDNDKVGKKRMIKKMEKAFLNVCIPVFFYPFSLKKLKSNYEKKQ